MMSFVVDMEESLLLNSSIDSAVISVISWTSIAPSYPLINQESYSDIESHQREEGQRIRET